MELQTFNKLITQLAKDYPTLEKQDPKEVTHWFQWFKAVPDSLALQIYNYYIENFDTRPTTPKLIKVLKHFKLYQKLGHDKKPEYADNSKEVAKAKKSCEENILSGLVPAYRDGEFLSWEPKEKCIKFRDQWYLEIDYCCQVLGHKKVAELLRGELRSQLKISNQNDILQTNKLSKRDSNCNWHGTQNGNFSRWYRKILAELVGLARDDERLGNIYGEQPNRCNT